MAYHYTYLSIDSTDGRMYIGSRTSKCTPENDSKYFGSFKDKQFKPDKKKILKIFKTREEAFRHEAYLHFVLDVSVNPLFANRARVTTTGFTWYGQKHSFETIEKIRKAAKNKSPKEIEKLKERGRNKKLTQAHIEALRQSNLGKPKSIETRQKISAKAKGRKCSESARLKIGMHNKGKWVNRQDQSKPITLKNIETNEIKFFISQKEAVRCLDLQQASLNRVATGKQYSCKNWVLHNL
jgi:hypothetical protein